MSLNPLHLQLLSIRLYNTRPIVPLPALSALPRPVSGTGQSAHTITLQEREGGRGSQDRRGGLKQIGGVGEGGCGDEGRDRGVAGWAQKRREGKAEEAEGSVLREVQKWEMSISAARFYCSLKG